LDAGREGVPVVVGGTAVDEDDGRVGASTVWLGEEAVDLPGVEVLVGHPGRRRISRRLKQPADAELQERGRLRAAGMRVPELAGGPDPGRADRTGRDLEPRKRPAGEVVAVELGAPGVVVLQEE